MMQKKIICTLLVMLLSMLQVGGKETLSREPCYYGGKTVPIGLLDLNWNNDMDEMHVTLIAFVHIEDEEVLLYFSPYDYEYDNRENALIVKKEIVSEMIDINKKEYPGWTGEDFSLETTEGKKMYVEIGGISLNKKETKGCIARKNVLINYIDMLHPPLEKETDIADFPAVPMKNIDELYQDAMPVSIYRFVARSWEYKHQMVEVVGVLNARRYYEFKDATVSWPFYEYGNITELVLLSQGDLKNTLNEPHSLDGTFVQGYKLDNSAAAGVIPVFSDEYLGELGIVRGKVTAGTGEQKG